MRRDDGAGGRKNDRRAAQDDDAVVPAVTIPASFCPATMCPLFAAEGSPVSGACDALCSRDCGWHDGAICRAGRIATGEVIAATATNGPCRNPSAKSADLENVEFQCTKLPPHAYPLDITREPAFHCIMRVWRSGSAWLSKLAACRAMSKVRVPRMLMCLCPIGASWHMTASS